MEAGDGSFTEAFLVKYATNFVVFDEPFWVRVAQK